MRAFLVSIFVIFACPVTADESLEFFQCESNDAQSYRNSGWFKDIYEYEMKETKKLEEFIVTVNHASEEITFSFLENISMFFNCNHKRDNPEWYDFRWGPMPVPLMYDNSETSLSATCIHATRPALVWIHSFTIDRSRNIYHRYETWQSYHLGDDEERFEYFSRYSETGTCKKISFNSEIITMASYLGTAEFCHAYGIDYRDLANKIINGTLKNTSFNVAFTEADFLQAVERGNFGEIYSVERGEFVSIPTESDDPFEGCKRTHLEVMKISKLK